MTDINYSIIVADDTSDTVDLVTEELRQLEKKFKHKIQIFPAYSAMDVLNIITKHRIDVLFLDYHFEGGMSGDEIIDKIYDPFENKLIILMSAKDNYELEGIITKRFKKLGSRFTFLRKPWHSTEMLAKYHEIENFFLNKPYPFPLAYTNNALKANVTLQGQFTAMKDLIESVLKYSVAILMSDLIHLNLTEEVNINIDIHKKLTFGAWLVWLGKLLDYFADKIDKCFMPELIELFKNGESNNNYFTIMKDFKVVRDQDLGHGHVKDERYYGKLVKEYSKPFELLFKRYTFTSRYILLSPEKTEFREDIYNDYTVRFFMGAEKNIPLKTLTSQLRLMTNEVYIYSPAGKILSLHPFFIYDICEECSLPRFYLLDGIEENQIEYNAFCNHRIKDRKYKDAFDKKFSKLKTKLKP